MLVNGARSHTFLAQDTKENKSLQNIQTKKMSILVSPEATSDSSFKFFGLGGSNEVGRSCHIIQYKGKTIMLDAGVHPAYRGMASLPFYDEFDLSTVDILLVSHFHLDHAASLPYVMKKTTFQGRVFMTHPTKAIYRWLMKDFVKVTNISERAVNDYDESNLYSNADLADSFDKIETIDYHSTIEVNGIKFTAFHAGHVLGAAMFQIDIAGVRILFTGDYSREIDRHLNSAEVPPLSSDVLIVESTFGTATHESRHTREKKLTSLIHNTVSKGGRVLLPVFALGRAQELLLILDEYWTQHAEELGHGQVPIYYASNLARKCLNVFQTYVNMMNDDIRKKFRDSQTNPFIFKNISYLKNLESFQDYGPSVMLASPGMLQSGISREVLEKWCPEQKNLVLVTGYSVEGTMAKFLMLQPDTIPSYNNPDVNISRKCKVDEISFAAHVDFRENLEFIEQINAKEIILVHGESSPMGRLKSALLSNFKDLKNTKNQVHVHNPKNCVLVEVEFHGIKIAKAIGNIVDEIKGQLIELKDESQDEDVKSEEISEGETTEKLEAQKDNLKQEGATNEIESKVHINEEGLVEEDTGISVSGIVVSDESHFDLNLVSLSDIRTHHSDLKTTILKERQSLKISCKKELIYWHLCQMFGDLKVLVDDDNISNTKEDEPKDSAKTNDDSGEFEVQIMNSIKVTIYNSIVTVEWVQNALNDTIADSVIAVLLGVESSPVSVKMSSKSCQHDHSLDHSHDKVCQKTDFEGDEKMTHDQTSVKDAEDEALWKVTEMARLFQEQFGDTFKLTLDKEEYKVGDEIVGTVSLGQIVAKINFSKMNVEDCPSKPLKGRIETILQIASDLLTPLV